MTDPGAAGLSALPTEILLIILRNLCWHCRESCETPPRPFFPSVRQAEREGDRHHLGTWPLRSSCLVSRRFRDIAQPIFYHDFVILGNGDGRLVRYLRTVAHRPDLAASVRRFYLKTSLVDVTLGQAGVPLVMKEAAAARGFRRTSFRHPSMDLQPWMQHTPVGHEIAAMALACLPNLTHLYVADPWSDNIVSELSILGVRRIPIHTLDVHGGNIPPMCRLEGILGLASSTLKTLNFDNWDGSLLTNMTQHLPKLRNISITNNKPARSLLSCCVNLDSFTYALDWTWHFPES